MEPNYDYEPMFCKAKPKNPDSIGVKLRGMTMFKERDTGEPQNWTLIVVVISLTVGFSLGIIIVCRVLLDSEDEINEPLIQGVTRDRMTAFLGIFTMSFFFGCWCCFCCGGSLCKAIYYCPIFCCNAIDDGAQMITQMHKIKREDYVEDEVTERDDVVLAAHGIPQASVLRRELSDLRPYERPMSFDQVFAMRAVDEQPHRQVKPPARGRAYSIDVTYE